MEDLAKKFQGVRTFRGKILPAWARRADERTEFRTEANESVRTYSSEVDGKTILYPTIRMRGPGLEKMGAKQAVKEAIKKKDYIPFKSPRQSRNWSRGFSSEVGKIK